MNAKPDSFIGRSVERTRGLPFPDRQRSVHRRHHAAESELRIFRAQPARARAHPQHRHDGRNRRAGVLGVFTGKDMAGVGGLPCGWLINNRRRHADEGAEALGAGRGQGVLRR